MSRSSKSACSSSLRAICTTSWNGCRHDSAGGVFVDLEVAGDISHTVAGFVGHATSLGIRFMTLVEAAQPALTRRTLAAGVSARSNGFPQFLMVPLLSSLG